MSKPLRVFMFGILSGAIWSVIAGTLDELFRSPVETATTIVSGILAGVATSFILAFVLQRFRQRGVVLVGLVSLPIGAFSFGVLIAVVRYIASEFTGEAYRFVEPPFNPIMVGAQYALLSTISIFAVVLFPLAVLTTFLLRRLIFWNSSNAQTA